MPAPQPLYSPTTGIGTFTNGTLSVFVATPGSEKRLGLKMAIGTCPGLNFLWRILDGSTVILQGSGLSNADGGFSADGEIMCSVNSSVGMLVVPAAGTSTCMANLLTRSLPGKW